MFIAIIDMLTIIVVRFKCRECFLEVLFSQIAPPPCLPGKLQALTGINQSKCVLDLLFKYMHSMHYVISYFV